MAEDGTRHLCVNHPPAPKMAQRLAKRRDAMEGLAHSAAARGGKVGIGRTSARGEPFVPSTSCNDPLQSNPITRGGCVRA